MAGHSQFKNIMYRKGAQDARRARAFGKLTREILVSARQGGPDPAMNARLRTAILAARAGNMPKDNIERTISRASGDDAAEFEEVRYEGYGPGGVAVLVDALTDSRNRTAAAVRSAFAKYGGNMGETGSVGFMFERIGQIRFAPDAGSVEDVFEASLDAGADDVVSDDTGHEIRCAPDAFNAVLDSLESRFGPPDTAELIWQAQSTVAVEQADAATLLKLLGALDDNDDVQGVAANFDIADDLMAELTS